MIRLSVAVMTIAMVANSVAFHPASLHVSRTPSRMTHDSPSYTTITTSTQLYAQESFTTRRDWLATTTTAAGVLAGLAGSSLVAVMVGQPEPAQAVGPVKINLLNPTYKAKPCPRDRPIPGEKAMKGMKASTLVEIMILVGDIGVPCGWNLSLTSVIFYFWATYLS